MQKLTVVTDGKKYELAAPTCTNLEDKVELLSVLGDYKAKLVRNEHKTTYESTQVYEFLFPNKKTRKLKLGGQIE